MGIGSFIRSVPPVQAKKGGCLASIRRWEQREATGTAKELPAFHPEEQHRVFCPLVVSHAGSKCGWRRIFEAVVGGRAADAPSECSPEETRKRASRVLDEASKPHKSRRFQ